MVYVNYALLGFYLCKFKIPIYCQTHSYLMCCHLSDSSSDLSSSDSLNSKSSLIVFIIFLFFITYLHSSKNICG